MSQETTKQKIKSFTDLMSWQKAHVLSVAIYHQTEKFPHSEQFGLTNQVRRAAVSVTSNLAEGFGRRSPLDRAHFYDMSRASLAEVQSQLLLARDIGYLLKSVFDELAEQTVEVHKLITGLINATKRQTS